MPFFKYTGLTAAGAATQGELEAENRSGALELLEGKGIRPVSVMGRTASFSFSFQKKVSSKDLARLTRDLATMLAAGIPLTQCLEILAEQTEQEALAKAIGQISGDVLGGAGLADSLAKHPKVFSSLYQNMVAAGEASGNLDGVLSRLATHLEKANELKRKIQGAMAYPAVIALVTVAAAILMFSVVVPNFAQMFSELGGEIPALTEFVMGISDLVANYGIYGIAAIALLVLALNRYGQTDSGAVLYDRVRLQLPVLGGLLRKSAIARFSQTASTLLASGVSILDALSISASTAGNRVLEKGLLLSLEKIAGGQTMAEPLQETGMFPPMVTRMIAVGERTGNLPDMLGKISESYESEVDTAVHAMTSVLEPVMIVIMAILIGGILIALYLPMFEMMTTIQ